MKLIYWMHPLFLMAVWAAVAWFSYLMPADLYFLLMRVSKVIEFPHLLVAWAGITAFSLGVLFGLRSVSGRLTPRQEAQDSLRYVLEHVHFRRTCLFFFAVMTLAYAIWLGPTLNAGVLSAFLSGSGYSGRQLGNQISGITTMTQFGVALAAVCGYGITLCAGRARSFYRILLTLVLVFAVYRSFIWSERLALVECAVPAMTAYVIARYRGHLSYRVLPVAAVLVVIFFFGVTEYFRSWNFYSQFGINIAYFSASRFLSYYISSFNNLAISIEWFEPTGLPLNTLAFFFKLPLPGFSYLNSLQANLWSETFMGGLTRYGNPEFNLFSGVGMAVSDFGIPAGIAVLSVHGFLSGRLYRLVQCGRMAGMLIYPVWMVGLLEFGRLLYWGTSRTLLIWVLLAILVMAAKRLLRNRRMAAPVPSV